MRFGIWTILYVMALLGSALATFGASGCVIAVVVLAIWASIFYSKMSVGEILVILLILGMLAALLTPAIPSAREAARRNTCLNHARQLTLALLNYEDVHGTFPPAYVTDKNGKPMHSWRVLILPYLGRNDLYQAYDFDEPWDGPNNSKLAAIPLEFFKCPSSKGAMTDTNYMAVIRPRTAWPDGKGSKAADFRDGMSKTIMLVEVHDRVVNWMEPRDLSLDEAVAMMSATDLPETKGGHQAGDTYFYRRTGGLGHIVGYADGHVEFLQFGVPADAVAERLTIDGGEVNEDIEYGDYSPPIHYELKWMAVYSVAVFVVLALLPAPWAWRKRHRQGTGDA